MVAQVFNQIGNYGKLEQALEKLAKLAPDSPEAWYDLAAIKATLGRSPEALENLKRALDLSAKRRAASTNAPDLLLSLSSDSRFAPLRASPDFRRLSGANSRLAPARPPATFVRAAFTAFKSCPARQNRLGYS